MNEIRQNDDNFPANEGTAKPVVEPILPSPMQELPRQHSPQKHTTGFFWPIVLIGFGVVLLLSNMGIFPSTGWAVLWRFWPIALIALGIDVMIGHRSVAGAIISGVLILTLLGSVIALSVFADQIPLIVDYVKPATMQHAQLEHPLNNTEQAFVMIDWSSVRGNLGSLQDSSNLIEADIDYVGDVAFNVNENGPKTVVSLDTYQIGVSLGGATQFTTDARWVVGLHPDVNYELELDSGSGRVEYDLSSLKLARLFIDSGSGSVQIDLPADGAYSVVLDSGSGSVAINVPETVGVRIELDSGSGSFNPDERFVLVRGDRQGDGVWESNNYSIAESQITLTIDQGSGSVTIK